MQNEKVLNAAVEMLKEINREDIEMVQIYNDKNNDGSFRFEVTVTVRPSDATNLQTEQPTIYADGIPIEELTKRATEIFEKISSCKRKA